jgi:hypothetical protein
MKQIEPMVDEKNFEKYSPSRAVNFIVGWATVVHHASLDVAGTIALPWLSIGFNGKRPETKANGHRQRREEKSRKFTVPCKKCICHNQNHNDPLKITAR